MSANEHWSYKLTCPKCQKTGTAEETELDGWSFMNARGAGQDYHWTTASRGFTVAQVRNPTTDNIVCDECGVKPEAIETSRHRPAKPSYWRRKMISSK